MKVTTNRLRTILSVILFAIAASTVSAQNVKISAETGRLIAGLGESVEFGFVAGWKSMWWHNQAPIKFFVSDSKDMNADGFLRAHGCDMIIDEKTGQFVVGCLMESFFQVAMPEGYKITGYSITFKNNVKNRTETGVSYQCFNKIANNWQKNGSFQETDASYNTVYESVEINRAQSETEYTLSRTILDESQATNYLYFKLNGNDYSNQLAQNPERYVTMISIEKFVVYFSADGDMDVNMTPETVDATARSHVETPFETGKIALGDIRQRKQTSANLGSATHYAYEYHEIEELDAEMTLYNEGSVVGGKVEDVAAAATITKETHRDGTDKRFYALKNGTYYIETPIEVVTTHGNHAPIGYRIMGGELNYYRGTDRAAINENIIENEGMFSIQSTLNIDNDASQGTSVYYLHPSGRYVRRQPGETMTKLWQSERTSTYGSDYRIFHEQDGEYTYLVWYRIRSGFFSYSYHVKVYRTTEKLTDTSVEVYDSEVGDYVDYNLNFSLPTSSGLTHIRFYNTSHYVTPVWDTELHAYKVGQQGTAGNGSIWKSEQRTRTNNQPAYKASDWTLTPYDKEGNALEPIVVSSSNNKGTFTFNDFNNDAVKFEISGLPDGNAYRALMTFDLDIQPLDPYINSVEIECENSLPESQITEDKLKRLTHSFVISDFTMSGSDFRFYVPENWSDVMPCTFSFKNVRSKYLDMTYYNGKYNGDARQMIVGSEYYGLSASKDMAIYKNVYDITEPTVAVPADYTEKVNSLLCGTQPFYFTNADELDHDYTSNAEKVKIRTLHQYGFSLDRYHNQTQTNVDGYLIGYPAGNFHRMSMSEDQSKHAYLFVADEPRYNIAPTRAIEHRTYAYYDIELTLVTKDFTPKLTWEKLYEAIDYEAPNLHVNSKWGVKVYTEEAEAGYLPVSVIRDKMLEEIGNSSIKTPESLKDILYMDASDMSTLIFSTNTGSYDGLETFRRQMSNEDVPNDRRNVIFFLPLEMMHEGDNYAYKSEGGGFMATEDIVLRDRTPFFAPYDISVGAMNKVTYEREITIGKYNKTKCGTLMLPFNLAVDADGIHKDQQGRGEFKLFTMNPTNCLSINKSDLETGAVGYFGALKSDKVIMQTNANVPYLFEVYNDTGLDNITLVAEQSGATVKATPRKTSHAADEAVAKEILTGEQAWGKISGVDYQFTHCGTFGGVVVPKSEGAFYMAQGKFLNTLSLNDEYTVLNGLPFRSWYDCKTSGGAHPALTFSIMFGTNNDTTGMDAPETRTYETDMVYTIDGRPVGMLNLEEMGRTLTKGIYIVNGKKVVIK